MPSSVGSAIPQVMNGVPKMAKRMTAKRDAAMDRKAGIKEGSKKDNALDRKRGVPVKKGRY